MSKLTYYRGRFKNPKWITHNKKSGKYCINRVIHNVSTYFGCYDSEKEAEDMIEYLNSINWNKQEFLKVYKKKRTS